MMNSSFAIGESSPLPICFGLECHLVGGVARGAEEIREATKKMTATFERPACSGSFDQRILDTGPEAVVSERHFLDELFHPGDETLCHGRAGQQPERLNAVSLRKKVTGTTLWGVTS